jgi:hypothetical protein
MDKIGRDKGLDNSDEISLKQFILKVQGGGHFLLSKWKIILASAIIGGVLGFC